MSMSEDKKVINLVNIDSLKEQLNSFEELFEKENTVKDLKYYKKILLCESAFETAIKQCDYLQKIISEISEKNNEQSISSSSK